MTYFPSADDARSNSRNNLIIYNEVIAIQKVILTSINNGSYNCTVSNTTMTSNADYYNVWKYDTTTNNSDAISDQMTEVSDYFTTQGYTISKIDNLGTFSWSIQW